MDGKYIYEIKLDFDGFSLGERALPPRMESIEVTKRLPTKVVAERAALLDAYIPGGGGIVDLAIRARSDHP
jgi:hypothetical protein